MSMPNTLLANEALVFADVVIPLFLPKTLTWQVPHDMAALLQPGCRVEVELGQKKRYAGVVKKIHTNQPPFEVKHILTLIDEVPVVPEAALQLWNWVANYYMCSEGEVMLAALPMHLKLSSETILQYNESHQIATHELSDREYLITEALEIKQELSLAEVQKILGIASVLPVVKKLLDKGICTARESMQEKYKVKTETYVTLHPDYTEEAKLEALLNGWKKSPRQMDLLLAYLHLNRTDGEVTKAFLLKKANATANLLDGLVQKQVLQLQKRATDRLPGLPKHLQLSFQLNSEQADALKQINEVLLQKSVCLLHGITGSGKTMLYLQMMADAIKQGNQCLYMLPEIALTAQVIRRLQQYLGGYVAVYHSKFNANERVELWNKVRSGEIQIVLGSRSALFLPFRQLKLIIIDEEHDPSYKQSEPPPRYHARDTAIYYAGLLQAKVVLGSATPSIETYYNCRQGKYGLVTLLSRYGSQQLPQIDWIDMKAIPPKERKGMVISPAMTTGMQQTLTDGRQVIVFQNRRGYTPYQVCATCGWIPKCEHCDVSLTYHKHQNKLMCHYCGTSYPVVKTCAQCGHTDFHQRNFGTEQLQEVLENLLPDASVGRMDTDSVRGKHSHDTLIQQFEQQKIQVLAGTQMVVKGLDFDHVGMVCIPDADALLHFADFRVNERAFQLIEQVSGRAGRRDKPGRVAIQLTDTNHPLLPFLQQHDYAAFFNWELNSRKAFDYPPFTRIILLQTRHKDKSTCHAAMHFITAYLEKRVGSSRLKGPAEPPVNRIRNLYIMELLLKIPAQATLLVQTKKHIRDAVVELMAQPGLKAVRVSVDVDAL